jgi:predicted O-methyltransferase YrrM
MADTRDKVGRAGVFLAGGVFKTAVYIFIIVFLIWVGKSAYQFGYDVFNQQAMSPGEGQQVTVVIKEGASAYKVGKTLEQKGLVKDALAFTIQERMSAYHGQIKAGTYSLYADQDHGSAVRRREQGRIEQPVIVEERMQTYINSLDMGNTPFLQELETKALAGRVPIIRRDMQSFMRMLLALKQPKRILEVGTAVGFSTLLMCEYGPEDMEIVTIENYEKRIPVAKDNFRRAGRESQITLLEGDAGEILKNLTGTFDMIFMDAAKGQYIHWLPDVLRLMKEGSVLVSDNVLQEGDIIESHYLVERRNRTIYKRMREYLWQLTHSPVLRTSVLPLGDGAAVSVKTGEQAYETTRTIGSGEQP